MFVGSVMLYVTVMQKNQWCWNDCCEGDSLTVVINEKILGS